MNYTPSLLTCPGSLVWATDIERGPFDSLLPFAHCPFCQARLRLEPGDRSGTLPAHDAADDRLPIPVADLSDFIAETQADVETRTDPFERDVVNHALARLIAMWQAAAARSDDTPNPGPHIHDYAAVGDNDVCVICGHVFDPADPTSWPHTDN